MERISLNKEVSLSRIIQGMWRLTSWGMSTEELHQFMLGCIEMGVTSFDTAEIYGDYQAERVLGDVLRYDPSLRDKIQIITKTGISKPNSAYHYTMGHYDTRYERILTSCQKSLENLGIESIDLYLIHREDPLIHHQDTARALDECLQRGWIKAYGVSNFDPMKFDALDHYTREKLSTNQIEVSPLCFEHFNNGNMDYLQKMGVSPMIWSPLAGGGIFKEDNRELHHKLKVIADSYGIEVDTLVYAWLLHHPVKCMPIIGSSKLDRLKHAVEALDVKLKHEDWYKIYCASGQQILR